MADDLTIGANAQEKLRSFARRLNNLLDAKADNAADTKELMKEVKNDGFEAKVLREAAKRLRADPAAAEEFEAKVQLYTHAIQGELFDDTRVTISAKGMEPIETTTGALRRVAERMGA